MKVYYEISCLLVSDYFFMRTEMKPLARLHLGPHRVIISPKFSCSFEQKIPTTGNIPTCVWHMQHLKCYQKNEHDSIQPTNNEKKTPNFYKHSGFANHTGCVGPTDSRSNTQTAMAVLKRIYFWHVRTTIHLPNDVPMTRLKWTTNITYCQFQPVPFISLDDFRFKKNENHWNHVFSTR